MTWPTVSSGVRDMRIRPEAIAATNSYFTVLAGEFLNTHYLLYASS